MNNLQHKPITGQKGFSLVELMISLVLGLILVGGAVNAFISSKQTYSLQEAMSRVQESGRFSLDLMARDLRHAGISDNAWTSPPLVGYAKGVTLPAAVDAVVVNSVQSEVVYIQNNEAITGGGDIAFYIATDAGTGNLALFRGLQAMVEGVEDMVVNYGFDTDNDEQVDIFQPSTAAGIDWAEAISARIDLLVVAGQGIVVDQRQTLPAAFGGGTAPDNRYYQAYSTTVMLRNVLIDK